MQNFTPYTPPATRRGRISKNKALAAVAFFLTGFCAVALLYPSAHSTPATSTTTFPVALDLSGVGPAVTPQFESGSDWSVRFLFDCTGAAPGLRVIEHGAADDGVTLVERPGAQGYGTMYVHGFPEVRWIEIDTACVWALSVTDGDSLPRATGGAA